MKKFTKLYIFENELPKACAECPLVDYNSDFPNLFCQATFELINDNEDIENKRHSSCPLKILK